jgi:hypothetical protein
MAVIIDIDHETGDLTQWEGTVGSEVLARLP